MTKVMFGMPCYGGTQSRGVLTSFLTMSKNPGVFGGLQDSDYSMLTMNYNILFCNAMNQRKNGATHFLLWHSDVVPKTRHWLDKMLSIMEEKKLDVLSGIIAQKNQKGLTSTAMDVPRKGAEDNRLRDYYIKRLTLKEIHENFPETITSVDYPELLVNSGLLLIDMRKPWAEECVFRFEDRIVKTDKGNLRPVGFPEDFGFSRQAKALGAHIAATREIEIHHMNGSDPYTNAIVWGTRDEDILEAEVE